jgi:hypothetical protein
MNHVTAAWQHAQFGARQHALRSHRLPRWTNDLDGGAYEQDDERRKSTIAPAHEPCRRDHQRSVDGFADANILDVAPGNSIKARNGAIV